MKYIAVATEDELSEEVVKRLLKEISSPLVPGPLLRGNGNGYLSSRMKNWCQMSQQQPLILLTDLDTNTCPSKLIDKWFGSLDRPKNFMFRVAVREVESWLLADHIGMRKLMGERIKLPPQPDTLSDPKQSLLHLAKNAPKDVRKDLVKEMGAISSQGIGYNSRLTDFVANIWDPVEASTRSPSLNRARRRLREFLVVKKH